MFEGESLQINTATRLLTARTSVMLTSDEGVVRGNRLSHDGRTGITEVGGRGYVAQAIVMDKAGDYPGFQPSSEIEPD